MEKLQRIQQLFSDLAIDAVEVDTVGQNSNILIINDDLIFRCPRYDEGKKRLAGEVELLKELQGRLPLPIPNPHYVAEDFDGYKMIRGEPLWRDSVTPQNRNQVAKQLGEFLAVLHSVQLADLLISVPHADQHEWWVKFYRRVKIKLFQFMRPEVKESVRTHFEPVLDNFFDFKPALRHGDYRFRRLCHWRHCH
jgi:aminoglycoside 2''-phosphotransferase